MGNDGGSIPRREDLVKLKKKEEKADPVEVERAKWFLCALTKESLSPPVVTCALGNLYNKEAVIKALLDKKIPETFNHIRSLRDIHTINFTLNPQYKPLKEKKSDNLFNLAEEAQFICPVSNIEVGTPNHKFRAIKTCGCVFSEKALRECPSDACLTCGKPFTSADVMILNPDEEELKDLKQKLIEKKQVTKKEKKSKKKSDHLETEESENKSSKRKSETATSSNITETSEKKKLKSG